MAFIVRRPWGGQPQEASPTSGLFDFVLSPGLGIDAVAARPIGLVGGASYAVGVGGVEARTSGGASEFVQAAANSSTLLSLDQATIIWHGRSRTAGANGEFGLTDNSVTTRCGAHVPFTDGTVYWDFGGASTGATRLTASGLSFSALDVWAFTTGPRGMEIWQNGILRASNSATPTRTASTAQFGLGHHALAPGVGSDLVSAFAFAYSKRQLDRNLLRRATSSPAELWGVLFEPRRVYIPGAVVGGGPGAQSITPTLYSNAQTFYTPTVSTGAATLAPALYSNAQTFYAPTVTRGAVSLAPTLYSNAQAFYSATVTQGAVLAPALYSNSQAFYAPTVSAGAVTLTPALYSNAQSFYSATVLNAGQILAPGLYSNAQAFYAPTVGVGAVTLTPALFTNSSTFYAASVSDGSASAFIKYFDVLSGKLLILRAL